MKNKRFLSSLIRLTAGVAAAACVFAFAGQGLMAADWPNFRGNDENNAVVSAPIPADAQDAVLSWAFLAGQGYDQDAAGCPILVGDDLIYTAGKSIVRVNSVTHGTVAAGTMETKSAFNIIPPAYADGLIFAGLAGGRIQAFDAETLEAKWLYQLQGYDGEGSEGGYKVKAGQPNCPIMYHNGYIYTGFWGGTVSYSAFVCVNAKTGAEVWKHANKGGYYWAGCYVCDDYLLIAGDNGAADEDTTPAVLDCLDPVTGETIAALDNQIIGNVRSSICFDPASSTAYFTSEGGYFYGVKVEKTETGINLTKVCEVKLSGKSTSTPCVYNGRAYLGVCGTTQFKAYSRNDNGSFEENRHNITVIDIATQTVAYTAYTQGFPQTSGLLTTAYAGTDGTVYVYFVDNQNPGRVRVIKDKPGQTALDAENGFAPIFFTPVEAHAQYAICSPVCDEYGTMYFKNDSGYMFAVSSIPESIEITKNPDKMTYTEGEVFDPAGMEVILTYKNGLTRDVSKYVSYQTSALAKDDFDFEICFPYAEYHDTTSVDDAIDTNDKEVIGKAVAAPKTSLHLTIKSAPARVTGVTVDPVSATMTVGETKKVLYSVSPVKAANKNVSWKSSDSSVAKVDGNGKVTALKAGKAVITVTTADGGKTASCTVTVKAKTPSNPFSDVKRGAFYYDAVLWAVENGVTSGTSATTFSPDMSCSRGQIVTFLYRASN